MKPETKDKKFIETLIKACKLGLEELTYQNVGRGRYPVEVYDEAFAKVTGPTWFEAINTLIKARDLIKKYEAAEAQDQPQEH